MMNSSGFYLKRLSLLERRDQLQNIPDGKVLINTINAFSCNQAKKDGAFAEALLNSDVLLPDGSSIVLACRFLSAKSRPSHRCTGWDLFSHEMVHLNASYFDAQAYWKKRNPQRRQPVVMFVGSSEKVLKLIVEKAAVQFPHLSVLTYSPPFKSEFSPEDSAAMVAAINAADPDIVWLGMTAPKQEKWAYAHWPELNIHCHLGSIGAVFDFYAGTITRAPKVMQQGGLEWLYRWSQEPTRLFYRYGLGNPLFIWNMFKEIFVH